MGLPVMNITHVPRRFVKSHWGGTETVIIETCKRLLKMGHATRILCPNALAKKDKEIIEGVQIFRESYFYPYFGLNKQSRELLDLKGGNLFSFSIMKRLMKEPKLDLIHLHTAKRLGGIGRYVAQKRKIPYVLSLHGGLFDVPAEEAATWTEPTRSALEWGKLLGWWVGSRRVPDDAAAIICVGEEERRQTQACYPNNKVIHLPNGVDPDRFSYGEGQAFRQRFGIPSDAFVILTVGRIDPQKNQLLVLQTLRELIDINPKTYCLIIGPITNQDYYDRIMKFIEEHELKGIVRVISGLEAGSQSLTDAYHAADVFVLPSVHEPFGIVILEAWASGLPVLASRVGGIPSFVIPHQDGLLFESNNRDSLVEVFKLLCDHPEEMLKIAEAGKRKASSQYSWDAITSRLINLYEEAVRENSLRQ
jgi:glycosyltransferase involved in cell wall biosynthesis